MGQGRRWVMGVDGCRGGWVAVRRPLGGRGLAACEAALCARFEEVLALAPRAEIVAVDMPIGLLDAPRPGGRPCDVAARRLLGRRAVSVFSPPPRRALGATTYDAVRGEGVTIQAFHLLPRLRDLDAALDPGRQEQVREAHPELALAALAGRPMARNKKRPDGRAERLAALARAPGGFFAGAEGWLGAAAARFARRLVAPDDLLDALALTWTAARIARGEARCLPAEPERDARGLRMEIWAP